MADTIRIPIEIVSRDALKQVEKFAKSAQSTLTKAFNNGARSVNKLNSALSTTVDEFERLNDENQRFQDNAKAIATRATIAFAGFSATIAGAVRSAAGFEDIAVQFEVLTGSAEAATAAVEQLSNFTAATPFRFEEVAQAGRQLLGFGFQVSEIEDRLKEIGDVAAASGTSINEISLIFGQVAAAGKLTGERLLQFQERAIPIGPAIAKTLGVAESAVRDLVSQGAVDFATFQAAFQSLSDTGGFAFEGLQKQSQTLSGILSTLGDNFNLLVADIGKRFLPFIKEVASSVIDFIQTLRQNPAIASFIAAILAAGAALSGLVATLSVAALAFNQISIAFSALRAGFLVLQGSIIATLAPLLPFIAGIGALIGALVGLVQAFRFINEETGALTVVFDVLAEVATDVFGALSPVGGVIEFIAEAAAKAARIVGGLFVTALSKLLSVALDIVKANPFGIFSEDQVRRVEGAQKRLDGLSDSLQEVGFDIGMLKKQSEESFEGINRDVKKVEFDELSKNANRATASIQKSFQVTSKESQRFIQEINKQIGDVNNNIQKSIASPDFGDAVLNIFGGPSEQRRQIANLQKQLDENLELRPLERAKQQKDIDALKDELESVSLVNVGTSLAQAFARGKAGAKDLAKNLSRIGVEAIAPGFGEAAGPLIDLFAQGPEATKAAVEEFAQSIPIIVENLILAAPAFVEAIADNIDVIIERLVDRTDEIIISLIRAIPRVSVALASALAVDVPIALIRSMPDVAIALASEIALRVPGAIVQGILAGLGAAGGIFFDVGKRIFDGLVAALRAGFDILGNIFSLGFKFFGGGRGPVEKFLGFDFPFIQFNQGGVVPGMARFIGDNPGNDTVPTLLSPGEIVIPRSAVNSGSIGVANFLSGLGIPVQNMFLGGLVRSIGDVIRDATNQVTSFISNPVAFASDFLSNPLGASQSLLRASLNIPGGQALLDALAPIGDVPLIGEGFQFFGTQIAQIEALLRSLAEIGAQVDVLRLITDPFGAVTDALRGAIGAFRGPLGEVTRAGLPFMPRSPGLQNGGLIPSGFPNDTFNANLSSGELVVDRSLTQRLDQSIAREEQGASGRDVTNALLAQILEAVERPTDVNTSIELDGRRLADAILQLTRTNARLV